MKLACLMVAATALAAGDFALHEGARADEAGVNATSGAPSAPDPRKLREAAEARDREVIRQRIASNIDRLKRCVAATAVCAENEMPKLLLGLTHHEIEAVLGPPQYQLRLAGNHLFYWTIPFASKRPAGAIRVQASFGRCYYREKDSSKDAVCDASVQ